MRTLGHIFVLTLFLFGSGGAVASEKVEENAKTKISSKEDRNLPKINQERLSELKGIIKSKKTKQIKTERRKIKKLADLEIKKKRKLAQRRKRLLLLRRARARLSNLSSSN